MLRTSREFVWIGLLVSFQGSFGRVAAQDVTLFYDHRSPFERSPREAPTYQLVGGPEVRGLPKLVEVPQGGRVCVFVRNGNPLIYKYSIVAETVKVADDSAYLAFLAALRPILQLPQPRGDSIGYPRYVEAVATLHKQLDSLYRFKWRSDTTQLDAEWELAKAAHQRAISNNSNAESLYQKHKGDPAFGTAEAKLVRFAHQALSDQDKAIFQEFLDAHEELGHPYCLTVDTKRLRLTLSIQPKSKPNNSTATARPTGANLLQVEAEPVPNERMEISGGLLFGSLDHVNRFVIRDSVVAEESDKGNFTRPSVSLLLRPWGAGKLGWLWLGFGVSTGKDLKDPDLFVGPVVRTRGKLVGSYITIGAGYIRSAVPTGLSSGAVGQKLPPNVSNLESVVVRSYKGGFGLLLSLSGLELKGKD